MQTRDEIEGLRNCREFSQPLKCLYQGIQIQEKVFYCFYNLNFPRKNAKLFVMALINRFSPDAKSCTLSLVRVISSCFKKLMLSKIRIFLA